jgi:hypothetical protein
MIQRVTEGELRQALALWLAPQLARGDLLVEELSVDHGAARIDVAHLGRSLCGFEIKSDYDTLDRLAHQMHAYHRVFDALSIVTTAPFVPQVALLLPPWWGIIQAHRTPEGDVMLIPVRAATPNPRQDLESIAALLWREEAIQVLQNHHGAKVPKSATRTRLYRQLAELSELSGLRDRVVDALQSRQCLRDRELLPLRSVRSAGVPSGPDDGWSRLAATS